MFGELLQTNEYNEKRAPNNGQPSKNAVLKTKKKALKNAMPMVCNAMRQCMGENDIILHETPSGYSSSLEIKYFL